MKRGANVTCVVTCEQILKGNEKLHPKAKFILSDATTVKLEQYSFSNSARELVSLFERHADE